jgi:hypothetical protein
MSCDKHTSGTCSVVCYASGTMTTFGRVDCGRHPAAYQCYTATKQASLPLTSSLKPAVSHAPTEAVAPDRTVTFHGHPDDGPPSLPTAPHTMSWWMSAR